MTRRRAELRELSTARRRHLSLGGGEGEVDTAVVVGVAPGSHLSEMPWRSAECQEASAARRRPLSAGGGAAPLAPTMAAPTGTAAQAAPATRKEAKGGRPLRQPSRGLKENLMPAQVENAGKEASVSAHSTQQLNFLRSLPCGGIRSGRTRMATACNVYVDPEFDLPSPSPSVVAVPVDSTEPYAVVEDGHHVMAEALHRHLRSVQSLRTPWRLGDTALTLEMLKAELRGGSGAVPGRALRELQASTAAIGSAAVAPSALLEVGLVAAMASPPHSLGSG